MDTPDSTSFKRCTKCGNEFPATTEYFYRQKKSLKSACKTCSRDARRRRYIEDTEAHLRSLATSRQWKHDHREQNLAYLRSYYWSNVEAQRADRREYMRRRSQEPEHRERARIRVRSWEQANPDKAASLKARVGREWRQAHPVETLAYVHARRARVREAGGTYTASDIQGQYTSQRGKCWWCNKPVGDNYHLDHRVPLSRGGSNEPENIVIACPSCNLSKGAKMPSEWIGRLL